MAGRSPPLPWSGEGSRILRPLALGALAILGIPLLRLALGDAAALAPVLLLAGAAGISLLLRIASMLHEGPERDRVFRALLLGLLLRVAIAVALSAAGGFPDERLLYDPIARLGAEGGPAVALAELARHPGIDGRWAYGSLLTATYGSLGSFPAAGRLLGILMGLGAALLAGEVARPLGGRRAAALAVAVLALHPEAALWSGAITRDALSALLVLAALAVAARVEGGLLRGRILLAAGPWALLALNARVPALALGAALLAAMIFEGGASLRQGRGGIARAALGLLLAGLALAAAWPRIRPWLDPEQISLLRSGVMRGDASTLADLASRGALPADFLPGLRFDGWLDALLFLPAGAAFALFAPFPWDAVSPHRAAYGAIQIAGYAVTILGIAGLLAAARRAPLRAAAPALFVLAAVVALAFTEGNSGTLARHRLPLLGLLAAGAGVLGTGLSPAGSSPPRPAAPAPAGPPPSAAS